MTDNVRSIVRKVFVRGRVGLEGLRTKVLRSFPLDRLDLSICYQVHYSEKCRDQTKAKAKQCTLTKVGRDMEEWPKQSSENRRYGKVGEAGMWWWLGMEVSQ